VGDQAGLDRLAKNEFPVAAATNSVDPITRTAPLLNRQIADPSIDKTGVSSGKWTSLNYLRRTLSSK
jgi:hypothetical protein